MRKFESKNSIQENEFLESCSIRFLNGVKEEVKKEFYKKIKKVNVNKNETIFLDKDKLLDIYIVKEGQFSIYKLNSQGEKKVIFILGEWDILNEINFKSSSESSSCMALNKGLIYKISKADLLSLSNIDNTILLNLIEEQGKKVRRLYRQLKNTTGSIRLDKKLAAKLWKLAKDYGKVTDDGIKINAPLSVTYISELMGAKRETISRQLKILFDEKLIKNINGYFYIIDSLRLEEYFKNM